MQQYHQREVDALFMLNLNNFGFPESLNLYSRSITLPVDVYM
jgi:hypothetical protein